MTIAAALDLAAEVADAHASVTLAAADHIDVSFSSGGLAFTAKRQPDALARVEAYLSPVRQQITLTGATPRPRTVAVANSDELKSRLTGLRSRPRRLRWQPEDLGVFAPAAIWTYLTLPLLLHRAEHVHRPADSGGVRRLRITLPATLAGHGSVQTLHVGADSLIRRHYYTATAFGAWARATQEITSYQTFDGAPIHRHNPHRESAVGPAAARPHARLDPDPLGAADETGLSRPPIRRQRNDPWMSGWRQRFSHGRRATDRRLHFAPPRTASPTECAPIIQERSRDYRHA